ncbi:hypothetical protein LCGC14_1256870, partial [marine sediment metagenome]
KRHDERRPLKERLETKKERRKMSLEEQS